MPTWRRRLPQIRAVHAHNDEIALGGFRAHGLEPRSGVLLEAIAALRSACDATVAVALNGTIECNPRLGLLAFEAFGRLAPGESLDMKTPRDGPTLHASARRPSCRSSSTKHPPQHIMAHDARNALDNELRSIIALHVRLGLRSITVYVRDPHWRGDLRLIAMPGVSVTEPMHGLLFPRHTSEEIFSGDALAAYVADAEQSELLRHGEQGALVNPARNSRRLFGDFVAREDVRSCARFIVRDGSETRAVVFFNFSRRCEFDDAVKGSLQSALRRIESHLDAVDACLRLTQPVPIEHMLDLQRIIDEFASAPSERLDTQHLAKQFLAACKRLFTPSGASVLGTVFLVEPGARLALDAYDGDLQPPHEPYDITHCEGIVSWVALRRRAILVPDHRESEFLSLWKQHHDTLVSQIAVPILVGSELIGVLSFESDSTVLFQPEHVRMLWSAANKFGIAKHLAHKSTRAREMLETIGKLSSGLPENATPLDELASMCAELLDADACDVWTVVEGAPLFRRLGEWNTGVAYPGEPRESGWTDYVVRSTSLTWLGNIEGRTRFTTKTWGLEQLEPRDPHSRVAPPSELNSRVRDAGSRSELCVPLRMGERSIGAAWFKYRVPHLPEPNIESLKLARSLGALLSVAVDSCTRNSSQARVEACIRVDAMRGMWEHLFPEPPKVPDIEIGVASHFPDAEVGGDFHAFDFEPSGDGHRVTFVIGDATGHGLIAALRMLPLLSAYKLASLHSSSPMFRIERMRRVADSCQTGGTALCVSIHSRAKDGDPSSRVFAASACIVGHEPAIVFRKEPRNPVKKLILPELPKEFLGSTLRLSETSATPLVEDFLELRPGDILVSYTDGVHEAHEHSVHGSGPFQRIGIERVVEDHWRQSAGEIAHRILEAAKAHARGVLDDDCTVIVCRIGQA
jgi:serine phosphatase RsbU (regulator of sigma subunit)/putative methionine-R-sulfoxide reductase with GAF domain